MNYQTLKSDQFSRTDLNSPRGTGEKEAPAADNCPWPELPVLLIRALEFDVALFFRFLSSFSNFAFSPFFKPFVSDPSSTLYSSESCSDGLSSLRANQKHCNVYWVRRRKFNFRWRGPPDSSVSSLILVGWCEEGHPATKNLLQLSQGIDSWLMAYRH